MINIVKVSFVFVSIKKQQLYKTPFKTFVYKNFANYL